MEQNKEIENVNNFYKNNFSKLKNIVNSNDGKWIAEYDTIKLLLSDINIKNKTVLDMSCGEGRFIRLLKEFHPKRIVGVDLYINKDEKVENVDYHEENCFSPLIKSKAEYDLIISGHFINNSTNKSDLLIVFKNIYNNLKSGGIFLGLVTHPFNIRYIINKKYGNSSAYTKNGKWPVDDFEEVYINVDDNKNNKLSYKVYYISYETLYEIIYESGLINFHWHPIIYIKKILMKFKKKMRIYMF